MTLVDGDGIIGALGCAALGLCFQTVGRSYFGVNDILSLICWSGDGDNREFVVVSSGSGG